MNPVLQTQALTRIIAGRAIVDSLTLAVAPNEVLAVMGASGSGKSSLLRLLNRLDEPTSGRILLDGTDIHTLSPRDLRRRVGLVLQTPYLFAGTIADNLAFGPRAHGLTLAPAEIEELLAQVRLSGYAGRDASRLSGGEAQRVSVARTLANRPEVLLLDEPTSALDADSKADVEQLILKIVRERKLACILVTHDPQQARRMGDRILVLAAGKQLRIGTPAEIFNDPVAIASVQADPAAEVPHA
jgi:putative ABC transport system ATP-binding protein